jgi:hypothetical protein
MASLYTTPHALSQPPSKGVRRARCPPASAVPRPRESGSIKARRSPSSSSPEARRRSGRHPSDQCGDGVAVPALAFAQMRAPECGVRGAPATDGNEEPGFKSHQPLVEKPRSCGGFLLFRARGEGRSCGDFSAGCPIGAKRRGRGAPRPACSALQPSSLSSCSGPARVENLLCRCLAGARGRLQASPPTASCYLFKAKPATRRDALRAPKASLSLLPRLSRLR